MTNALNTDIRGRVVLINATLMPPGYGGIPTRLFLCQAGFGCAASHEGNKVVGMWAASINKGVQEHRFGYEVERLATRVEVAEHCPEYLSTLPDDELEVEDAQMGSERSE